MEDKFKDRFGGSNLDHLLDKALKNTQDQKNIEVAKAKEESAIDSLTKVGNRKALDEKLPKLIEALNHEGQIRLHSIMVINLDVDKFKEINDNAGHAKGDELLIAVAARIKDSIKESAGDLVFRSSARGDEFLIVAPNHKDLTDEELNKMFVGIQHRIHDNLSINIDGANVSVTISMGYSVMRRGETKTAVELLRDADLNMYKDKRSRAA